MKAGDLIRFTWKDQESRIHWNAMEHVGIFVEFVEGDYKDGTYVAVVPESKHLSAGPARFSEIHWNCEIISEH